MLNIDQFRGRFPSLCHAKTLRVAETVTQDLFSDTATDADDAFGRSWVSSSLKTRAHDALIVWRRPSRHFTSSNRAA